MSNSRDNTTHTTNSCKKAKLINTNNEANDGQQNNYTNVSGKIYQTIDEIENEFRVKYNTYDCNIQAAIIKIYNGIAMDKYDNSGIINLVYGDYHQNITKNYSEMEKYYLLAIEKGNTVAMTRLGLYHHYTTKNYGEMEKYYLLAIEKSNTVAMTRLGLYHQDITKNYSEMEKYYLMAIETNNNIDAINNLGYYYQNVKKDYPHMAKYYFMGIDLKESYCAYNLAYYYYNNNDYNNSIKYYSLAVEYGCVDSRVMLARCYKTKNDAKSAIKYYLMYIDHAEDKDMKNYILCELAKYCDGLNMDYDMVKYYGLAADNGSKTAAIALFKYYFNRDLDHNTYYYFTIAINTGCDIHDMKLNALQLCKLYINSEPEIQKKIIILIKKHKEYNQYILKFEGRRCIYGSDGGSCYACLENNIPVISWPCHNTHSVCYNCYLSAEKCGTCGICREPIP